MNNQKKIIGLGALVIVSLMVALYNFSGSRNNESVENNNKPKLETKTESTSEDIKESDITPNYTNNEEKPIWIKNITFLSDNNQSFNTIMMLKSKLNEALKTIDKDVFEIELIENTYVENEKGFSVEAKADKIDGKILIEYDRYEYTFSIIQN